MLKVYDAPQLHWIHIAAATPVQRLVNQFMVVVVD
jgi:hypothetical protein